MTQKAVLSRRDFLGSVALGAAGLGASGGAGGPSAAAPLVYVGTYTTDGWSRGIHRYRMHPDSGALRPDGAVTVAANPSFLALHPDRPFLYAVNELTEFEGALTGAVTAFAVERPAGALTALNQRASHGGAPCYVTVDRTGRFALVANYVGGSVAVLPIRADGSLGEATSVVRHAGSGPHPERQRSPHAHCIILDAANRYALVADLGTDRVTAYPFDARRGTLTQAGASHAALTPGAGPRHLAFHPGGRMVYVVNELDSTLTVLHYTPGTGALRELQTIPTLTAPAATTPSAQQNSPADLHVAPSGRFLYLSNRGHDSITVLSIHPTAGTLEPVELVSTQGRWPRNFAIDPTGRFLFVANQRSDSIAGFRVHPATGRLTPTGHTVELPAPVCIRFADAGGRP